jgi:hypothetical protein
MVGLRRQRQVLERDLSALKALGEQLKACEDDGKRDGDISAGLPIYEGPCDRHG